MDSEHLERLFLAVTERSIELHSVLIVRHGYIVTEAYFPPYEQDTKHDVWSVTKSFVSALVGIAIEKGYIDGVTQPVLDFFPDRAVANRDSRKEAMTLEHLLTMTSGLDWSDGTQVQQMMWSRDWVQFILDRPMAAEPGTQLNYNSGNTHLLSAILQQATGMSALDFTREHLFEPLGISVVTWESDPDGISIGGWGIQMTPRDMARFGYLYSNDGVWDGQQVVPAGWVRASVEEHVEIEEPIEPWGLHIGYGWWVHQIGAYAAHGRGGQFIYVIPHLDMVVVFTSGIEDPEDSGFVKPELLVRDFIMPAAISSEPLPDSPDSPAVN